MLETLARWRRRVGVLLRRRALAHEMDEEMQLHLELETEDLVRAGLPVDEARRRARMAFGGVERFREEGREARAGHNIERLLRELRLVLRTLRHSRGFAGVAVLTVALGIGTSTAIFTLLNRIVLQPLPYPAAERLAYVTHNALGLGLEDAGLSTGTVLHYRQFASTFEALGTYQETVLNLSADDGSAERVHLAMTDPELFDVLGVRPVLGRAYTAADVRGSFMDLNWTIPILIGHELWMRRFGGDSSVVGSVIRINDSPREVIGILPPRLAFPTRETQVWMLFVPEASVANVGHLGTSAVARLRPGVTPHEAELELRNVLPAIAGQYRDATPQRLEELGLSPSVRPLREVVVGDSARLLWALFGGVTILLLVASVNVANLLLVRAEHRTRETAVRRALGASSADVARMFLLESAVLTATGTVLALGIAGWALSLLVAIAPEQLPRLHEVRLDGQSVLFAASLAVLLAILFGAIGVWHQQRRTPLDRQLRVGGLAGGLGPRGGRVRGVLVASQMALALTLLVCAALMLRSVGQLMQVPRGFDPAGVLTVETGLPYAKAGQHGAVYAGLLDRLRAVPGVTAAAAVSDVPLTGTWGNAYPVHEFVDPAPEEQPGPSVALAFFTPGYLELMGTRVVAGTTITDPTTAESHPVLISSALSRRLFSRTEAVGATIQRAATASGFVDPRQPSWTVVGVVEDVRQRSLAEPPAEVVYVPLLETPVEPWIVPTDMTVVLHSTVPPETLVGSVRRVIADYDPSLSVARVRSMESIVAMSSAETTLLTWLLLAAGAAALFLGAVGIWGGVAYAVRQRTAEIGVRIALGAPRSRVVSLVVGETVTAILIGGAIGLGLSVAAARTLRALLFGVSPADPPALLAAAGALIVVGCLAAYLPARAAARINPVIALRSG